MRRPLIGQSFLQSIGYTLPLAGLLDLVATPALGQQSRADEIARKQAEKNAQLTPNRPTLPERALDWFEDHFTDPNTVYLTFGGIYPAGGFAAVIAGVAKAPASYEVAWLAFDNRTGTATPIGQPVAATREEVSAPPGVPTGAGSFLRVEIRAVNPPHPSWAVPVHAYFQRTAGWKLVGFERLPDGGIR